MSRLVLTYDCSDAAYPAQAVAEAVAVEQTIEFPAELAPEWIRADVVARIEQVSESGFVLSFNPDVTGGTIPQLLNVVWGNASLFPGVRIVDVALPDDLPAPGPRWGVPGLREMFDAGSRPLLATALKPMGTSSADLAAIAGDLARAGIDLIKDDHSLADQHWAPWEERVARCAAAVRDVADETGTRSVYVPSLNVAHDQLVPRALRAQELGAGGLMVLPGITGFDSLRVLAEHPDLHLPLMAHPSMLGSMLVSAHQGLPHRFLLGELPRLAGADLTVFPHSGGRFSFSPAECAAIASGCRVPAPYPAAWPAPGGGMSLERVPEIVEHYGPDVCLLIGGDLHRGQLRSRAEAFRSAVEM